MLKKPWVPVLLLALAIFLGWKAFGAWREYRDLNRTANALEARSAYFESENRKLRQEMRLLRTPEGEERDGKARLNLKLPDEKVVVVIPAPSSSPAAGGNKWGFWGNIGNWFRSFFAAAPR